MRDNWDLCIRGNSVILVPYKKKFVEKYHHWMKDPFLLESTASEPLTIEEEYDMQKLWKEDPKKCTFIVLAAQAALSSTDAELENMVGDVNLFMNDYEDKYNAEIEVMIAEPRFRRCGLAREALKLMIHYGTTQLKLTRFFAKIGKDNLASIALFRSLSFREVNYVEAFGEFEYEFLPTTPGEMSLLLPEWGSLASITPYISDEVNALS